MSSLKQTSSGPPGTAGTYTPKPVLPFNATNTRPVAYGLSSTPRMYGSSGNSGGVYTRFAGNTRNRNPPIGTITAIPPIGPLPPVVPAPTAPSDTPIPKSNRKHARGLSPFLQNIVKEGFVEVQKRKKNKKIWIKFWCILWSERMCLYRNERKDGSTIELMSPVSMINIADLESVSFGKHKGGYFQFTLIMRNSRVSVYFRCKQQAERRSWVSAIKQKIDDLQHGRTVPTNSFNGFESVDYLQGGRVNGTNSCLIQ